MRKMSIWDNIFIPFGWNSVLLGRGREWKREREGKREKKSCEVTTELQTRMETG